MLLVLAWFVMWITPAAGYEFETHDRLSRAAFQSSGVVAHLESAYGIKATDVLPGPLSLFRSDRFTPQEWMRQGARDEDSPLLRVLM